MPSLVEASLCVGLCHYYGLNHIFPLPFQRSSRGKVGMYSQSNRLENNNITKHLIQLLSELEARENLLQVQQREVLAQIQIYSQQLMEHTARIEEVSDNIHQAWEELEVVEQHQEEDRRRRREEMVQKRREIEEGRAKARQWWKTQRGKGNNKLKFVGIDCWVLCIGNYCY